jgi:hypothetical protein
MGHLPLVERLDFAQDCGHVVGANQMKTEAHDIYPVISEALGAEGADSSAPGRMAHANSGDYGIAG